MNTSQPATEQTAPTANTTGGGAPTQVTIHNEFTHQPEAPRTKPTAGTLDDLRNARVLRGVPGPSGFVYDIRPLNLERHALSGGLPAKLRAAAMRGADGVNELLGADDDKISEEGSDVQEWLDRLVAEVIATPVLFQHHPGSGMVAVDAQGNKVVDPEHIDAVPPVDYRWALAIAMGECDEDGDGRRLWGREPLSRWASFRDEHRCDTDCESCSRLLARFSPPE